MRLHYTGLAAIILIVLTSVNRADLSINVINISGKNSSFGVDQLVEWESELWEKIICLRVKIIKIKYCLLKQHEAITLLNRTE